MNREAAHVLVVDDQDSGRYVKTQILRRAGFIVYEASRGQAGIDISIAEPIDLVVLDVNLPDIGGIEVGRRIRAAKPGPPALQILHVSSTAIEDSDRARGLNAGADAYLLEPLDPGVLVATVDALLRVRRAETSLADALAREQHARAEAEHANRLKDEFIATLSHELRTPLNALMGWIWQLRQTAMTDEARGRALDSLERNTRIQAQLINDLLDVSRITKGKLQLQMRVVDIATIVEAAGESVRAAANRKGVAFEIDARSILVSGDSGRLQQIVANLLNNAVQFTPEGGQINLTVEQEPEHAVISVVDSGAGIEPAMLPDIFEPFRQGPDGLTRAHGGLGLGLAVVQQLVELHEGEVTATSDGPGLGSTFVVKLPRTDLAADDSADEDRLLLDGLDVLIVADTEEAREGLASILESSGANVMQAEPATPAQNHTAVVVVDHDHEIAVSGTSGRDGGADATAYDARIPKPVRAATLVRSIAAIERGRLPVSPRSTA